MLQEGYNVCIFPEINYLDDTILLADFKRGAFKIAIENNLFQEKYTHYNPPLTSH